ncbi:hypothetical protein AMK00_CH01055 [Rhizobium sp. N621]|nr:hypothetical protein AMK00_CH01055 [Rhizobium sp. N621]ANL20809.1 hypothetical protein AMJ96_CH01048 [Rhizobium sp. N113]ANM33484.1 hypothetical protein AMK04_CH01045 [Rhizobium sp. N871]
MVRFCWRVVAGSPSLPCRAGTHLSSLIPVTSTGMREVEGTLLPEAGNGSVRLLAAWQGAPPSVLPDISPTRGEIG